MKQRKTKEWIKLDNAAKIFPPTTNERNPKVFRFTCELNEDICGNTLEKALELTLESFPIYRLTLKHGLFWYYFEASNIKPTVSGEHKPPCGMIYDRNSRSLLFEVSYFGNRINCEVYHALSDGTGALQFIKSLVLNYLIDKHPDEFAENRPSINYDASFSEQKDDSFRKYYNKGKKGVDYGHKAYRIQGSRLAENRLRIIEGIMPVKEVLGKSREFNTTLTAFVTAVLLCSINEVMLLRDKKLPVVAEVPVNLRKFFHSESARNFFSVIDIEYNFGTSSGDLKDVIESVNNSFKNNLTVERLNERMNSLSYLENNFFARVTPLFIKDVVLRYFAGKSDRNSTCAVSNLGKIEMPHELDKYIRNFDVFASTDKLQVCLCSYKDNLTVSFTSHFVSTDIQKSFFRTLSNMGISVEIASNQIDDE